ncbi:hypothetical protein OIU76_028030 [Salix suchowensis]|nr:hypothetical protein OIU76_028030 [Salix suchowensis]
METYSGLYPRKSENTNSIPRKRCWEGFTFALSARMGISFSPNRAGDTPGKGKKKRLLDKSLKENTPFPFITDEFQSDEKRGLR